MANSADQDQTSQNEASDQGPHCLQIVLPFFYRNISHSQKYLNLKLDSSNI